MMRFMIVLSILMLSVLSAAPISAKPLHHLVFFGMDREQLRTTKSFLDTNAKICG